MAHRSMSPDHTSVSQMGPARWDVDGVLRGSGCVAADRIARNLKDRAKRMACQSGLGPIRPRKSTFVPRLILAPAICTQLIVYLFSNFQPVRLSQVVSGLGKGADGHAKPESST